MTIPCKLPLGTVENIKSLLFYEGLDDIIYHPIGETKPRGGFLYDKTKTLTIQDRIIKRGNYTEEWACHLFGVFKVKWDKGVSREFNAITWFKQGIQGMAVHRADTFDAYRWREAHRGVKGDNRG